MMITAVSGVIGYALQNSIQPLAGLILGLSAAGSGMASAKFANKINEQTLSKIVGVIFIILGIIMIVLNLK